MHTPHHDCLRFALVAALLALLLPLTSCTSGMEEVNLSLADNAGSNRTTTPGDPLRPHWFFGKWDIDGRRTNLANGRAGLRTVPNTIYSDILGDGWKFEPNGELKIDGFARARVGQWRIDGNRLYIIKPGQQAETYYLAHFDAGFLYLYNRDGQWAVFEYNKFFGL